MARQWKRAIVWANNNKVAEIESTEATLNSNGERGHTQDGVDAVSEGNVEVDIRVNILKYVDQKEGAQAIEDAMFAQTPVLVTYKIGATAFAAEYRVQQGSFSSENRTGTSKGSFTLINASVPDQL